jgi:hypothetical protein
VIKGCNIFLGKKLAKTCSFVGGHIIVQQEKSFSFPNPPSESEELVLEKFKDSAIILDAI